MDVKTINLALQGGGAHGAFTWGVLDRLLEDERLRIEGISATSAGAMNAAVLVNGFMRNRGAGAREALTSFWHYVSDASNLSPLQPTWHERFMNRWNMDWSPSYLVFDLLSRMFSPYQLNPFNWNPLRDLLETTINFERLRSYQEIKLFICATNVETGKIKVFHNHQLSVDTLLASACLPFLHQTVEIDGEYYWDGGYMGNPAIFPLIYHCDATDVVIVQVNPIKRPGIPLTARAILNRINEISFNSSLMREMRAVAFVTHLTDKGIVEPGQLRRMMMHMIEAEDLMAKLGFSSKLNADWNFLTYLRDIGRERADHWLKENFTKLGSESTVNIEEKFL